MSGDGVLFAVERQFQRKETPWRWQKVQTTERMDTQVRELREESRAMRSELREVREVCRLENSEVREAVDAQVREVREVCRLVNTEVYETR